MEAARPGGRSRQLVSASRGSSPALPEGVALQALLTLGSGPRTVGGRQASIACGGAAMNSTARPAEEAIRVLFIEDDPAVAEMYKLKLELDGYQVVVVADDDHVLQEAASLRPDMIFLDLRPGQDRGLATLQRLRATTGTRDVPVIILSSQGASE